MDWLAVGITAGCFTFFYRFFSCLFMYCFKLWEAGIFLYVYLYILKFRLFVPVIAELFLVNINLSNVKRL